MYDPHQARIMMMQKFQNFIDSENPLGLIYAPPQVGKTEAIVKFIEASITRDMPVIVSCDNKNDQMNQIYDRVAQTMLGRDVELFLVTMRKFNDELNKIVRLPSKRYVIFVMNNASQIKKLRLTFLDLSTSLVSAAFKMTTRFSIVHDEADTHIKNSDIANISQNQKASHQAWLEFYHAFDVMQISVKRMFVSATPEAVVMLHKIQNVAVFRLDVPESYMGYGNKNFRYNLITSTTDTSPLLIREIRRIKESASHEVILYCMDKAIRDHYDTLIRLNRFANCIVNTYNSNGIRVMFKTQEMFDDFKQICENYNIAPRLKNMKPITVSDLGDWTLEIKDLTIANFYTMCKAAGETCVVTIGKDLIARGISYCSTNRKQPFAATRMFLHVGNTMHNVGITQAVGRIMGTARPELDRELYANESIVSEFKKFNQNQKKWIGAVAASVDEISVKTIIDSTDFCIFKRKIDRPALKLKMKMAYEYNSDSDSESYDDDDDEEDEEDEDEEDKEDEDEDPEVIKSKRIIEKWWTSNTISGQVLRYMYVNGENGLPYDTLVEFVKSTNSHNPLEFVEHMTKRIYGKIYERITNTFYIGKSSRDYISRL